MPTLSPGMQQGHIMMDYRMHFQLKGQIQIVGNIDNPLQHLKAQGPIHLGNKLTKPGPLLRTFLVLSLQPELLTCLMGDYTMPLVPIGFLPVPSALHTGLGLLSKLLHILSCSTHMSVSLQW